MKWGGRDKGKKGKRKISMQQKQKESVGEILEKRRKNNVCIWIQKRKDRLKIEEKKEIKVVK